MRRALLRYMCTLVIAGLCLYCHKEQNQITPEFSFKAIKNGSVVWNAVDVEVEIPNPNTVASVDFSINGQSIGSRSGAPFLIRWNTTAMDDGAYELKAVQTDRDGLQKSISLQVEVRNTLITFSVPNNQLRSDRHERGWVFLSSQRGGLIAISEFRNGETIKLANPDASDKSFLLSEVYLAYDASLLISSFQDVPRGQWTLGALRQYPTVVGELSVNFKDSLEAHPYYISASGDSKVFFEGGNSIKLNLTQSPTRLFIREISKPVNHYKLVEGLTFDTSYSGSFSELNNPLRLYKSGLRRILPAWRIHYGR